MDAFVKDRRKNLLSLGLIFLVLALTLIFLMKDRQLSELFGLLRQADPRWLLAGLGAMALFFGLEALCLGSLTRQLGFRASPRRCYAYSLIDFYFSSVTPGCCGGQPSLIYFMHRDGIPPGVSSLALLSFNLSYHWAALLLLGGSILGMGLRRLGEMGAIKYFLLYGAAAQLFLALAFLILVFSPKLAPALVRGLCGLLLRLRLIRDKDRALAALQEQTAHYQAGGAFMKKHPAAVLRLLAAALLHLFAYYSMVYWVYRAFGLEGTGFWTLVAMQTLLVLSVESLPVPGGVGIMEGAFVLHYAGVFGPELVLPAMLLLRGLTYYFWLPAGGLTAAVCLGRACAPPEGKRGGGFSPHRPVCRTPSHFAPRKAEYDSSF
ncbi:MAG: lysylphosphatidylglycerol synthase transmembrane domain-containing protein [Bacillota bacterium]|nr:lysylphosphatidylglycerol synthase transmembrane domain-containing protein [Bacillota bacterium]